MASFANSNELQTLTVSTTDQISHLKSLSSNLNPTAPPTYWSAQSESESSQSTPTIAERIKLLKVFAETAYHHATKAGLYYTHSYKQNPSLPLDDSLLDLLKTLFEATGGIYQVTKSLVGDSNDDPPPSTVGWALSTSLIAATQRVLNALQSLLSVLQKNYPPSLANHVAIIWDACAAISMPPNAAVTGTKIVPVPLTDKAATKRVLLEYFRDTNDGVVEFEEKLTTDVIEDGEYYATINAESFYDVVFDPSAGIGLTNNNEGVVSDSADSETNDANLLELYNSSSAVKSLVTPTVYLKMMKTVTSYSKTDSKLTLAFVNLLKIARGSLKLSIAFVDNLPPNPPQSIQNMVGELLAAAKSTGDNVTNTGASLYPVSIDNTIEGKLYVTGSALFADVKKVLAMVRGSEIDKDEEITSLEKKLNDVVDKRWDEILAAMATSREVEIENS